MKVVSWSLIANRFLMNGVVNKYSILLFLLFAILMVTVQSKDNSSKDSNGGGPFAFLQNIFKGFGGDKKK